MKNSIHLALVAALCAAPFAASATESNLGYTGVELGYAQNRINTGWSDSWATPSYSHSESLDDTRLKGYYLNGSIELGKAPLYAFGSYSRGKDGVRYQQTDTTDAGVAHLGFDTDVTAQEYSAGLGYYYSFNPNINLIAELSYVHQSTSASVNRASLSDEFDGVIRARNKADGGRLSVGYDAMLAKQLEGWVKANYTDMEHADRVFSGTVGLQYKITPMWGITAQGEFADQVNTYKVGVKASF